MMRYNKNNKRATRFSVFTRAQTHIFIKIKTIYLKIENVKIVVYFDSYKKNYSCLA